MDFVYTKNLKVDVYIPNQKNFKTLVYFHGGGLVEGSRSQDNIVKISNYLKDKGICVFNFDYSLYPNAKFPDYILDAAKAVKCAFEKSKELGGSGEIFVSGSSAGGYLSMMLLTNKEYLLNEGINPLSIKGWFIESSQMTDHFHILEFEEKLNPTLERITKFSPVYYVSKDFKSSPIKLIAYDEDIPNRLKQNQSFYELVKKNSNIKISLNVFKGKHCDGSSNVRENYLKELVSFILNN